ncbi:TPA: ead/Ea22-like family protein [Raoultella ornithinolytica]|nr:ead/Ea22-like family protein [Raoultella ornithinolytica]HEC2635526.1 ead/Ea22-like family protein [Raoultella ornithinolytica]
MTTDITELAQSLKAAAENAGMEQWVNNRGEVNTADYEVDGGTYIDHICDCEIVGTESPRAEFIALANPAHILALVEALEKAQQVDEELCRLLPPGAEYMDPPDGGDVEPIEQVRRMVADYRQRIAEMESRSVKLPQRYDLIGDTDGNCSLNDAEMAPDNDGVYLRVRDVREMLTAAGIKWEAE